MAVLKVHKDITLLRVNHMSILKVRKDVMILKEKWDVAIRRPNKHVMYLIN